MNDKSPPVLNESEAAIRDFALGFPETTEDYPWGERALGPTDTQVMGLAGALLGQG